MNNKMKFTAAVLVFVLFIGGSMFAYNKLKEGQEPGMLPGQTETKPANPIENGESQGAGGTTEGESETLPMALNISMLNSLGEEVKFDDLLDGRPIVLNFWATWCQYCTKEMPDFEAVYKEMGADVQFIMLNMTDGKRETVEVAQEYIEEKGFTFPVYYDIAQEAAYGYGIYSLPITLFIAPDGELITMSQGLTSKEVLLKGIEIVKEADK